VFCFLCFRKQSFVLSGSVVFASSTGNISVTQTLAKICDKVPNNSLLFARSQAGMKRNGTKADE
jgi:hypothetical protein